jgi:hypothetical protein
MIVGFDLASPDTCKDAACKDASGVLQFVRNFAGQLAFALKAILLWPTG